MSFDASTFLLDLRNDIGEGLNPPATRSAEAQPRIEITPLDDGNRPIAALLPGSLNVPLEVPVQAGIYAYVVGWEARSQMRLNEGLEMQRREAAQKMDASLLVLGRLADDLQCFCEAHATF